MLLRRGKHRDLTKCKLSRPAIGCRAASAWSASMLGVSITIVDGTIAIEQTKTEIPAAVAAPNVDTAAATDGAVSAVVTE